MTVMTFGLTLASLYIEQTWFIARCLPEKERAHLKSLPVS